MSGGNPRRRQPTTQIPYESAAAGAPQKAPKKRTKSGCLTCRRRRIKCGEEKPICKNCSKTKRACEQPPVSVSLRRRRPSKIDTDASNLETLPSAIGQSDGGLDIKTHEGMSMHHRRSYTSSRSQGSQQQSPNEHYRTSQSPQLSFPGLLETDVTVPATFGSYHSASFMPARSYEDPHYIPSTFEVGTPGAAFGHLALESPLFQPSEAGYFPSYDTSSAIPEQSSSVMQPHAYTEPRRIKELSATAASIMPLYQNPLQTNAAIQSRQDFADRLGLAFQPSRADYGTPLTERQAFYLRHFMLDVNMNFTITSESVYAIGGKVIITESNLWTAIIPSMALQCTALLHAVLAISALHEANVRGKSEEVALWDYQQAIKHLAKALLDPSADQDELLAACLILAYFETMSGQVVKWGRHLQGSCDLVRNRILAQYTTNHPGHYQFIAKPSIADHLIWFHIHQDTVQSILSGNGLFLELKYMQMCPIRGDPGSVVHTSDQLRILLARIGDFVSNDRTRKQADHSNEEALFAAISSWEELIAALEDWQGGLDPFYASSVVSNTMTPFGTVLVFAHPAIASFQILHSAALLYLHRSHPTYSPVPAEAIRVSAGTTFRIEQDIIKMLSGIMLESADKTIEHGSHIKAMINSVLAVFLAGIAIRDEGQREFVEHLVKDIYKFTGWRTALRVLQGFDVAWGRKPRAAEGLDLMSKEGATLEHESSQDAAFSKETKYANLDKAETMSVASGILGRLKSVDGAAPPPMEETKWYADRFEPGWQANMTGQHAPSSFTGDAAGKQREIVTEQEGVFTPFEDWGSRGDHHTGDYAWAV